MEQIFMKPKTIYTGRSCVTDVRAIPGDSAFLIDDASTAVLCDSGFAFTGAAVAENVRQVLGNRPLDYILLTHSHYDHVMAVPHILEVYPEAKVVAGEYTARVFARGSAKAAMCRLNEQAAQALQLPPADRAEELRVDAAVRDGEEIRCGELIFQAIHLPGHTNCSFGYYLAGENLLLSTETLGVYFGKDTCLPAFLVGYQRTLDSLRRAQQLCIERLLIPHYGVIEGENVPNYLKKFEMTAVETAGVIAEMHRRGQTKEEIFAFLKEKNYKEHVQPVYPFDAFRMNMEIMIELVIKETEGRW